MKNFVIGLMTLASLSSFARTECQISGSGIVGYLEVRSESEVLNDRLPGIASALRFAKKSIAMGLCDHLPENKSCKITSSGIVNKWDLTVEGESYLSGEYLDTLEQGNDLLNILKNEGICSGEIKGEVKDLPETFRGTGSAKSNIPLLSGCLEAKKRARAEAHYKCTVAGFSECKEILIKKNGSTIANPLRNNAFIFIPVGSDPTNGSCSYTSIYEGIGTL